MKDPSAGGPFGGYLWQLRRALVELLGRNLDEAITIEAHDDICVVRVADNRLLTALQAKHSLNEGTVTTRSVELWKTLRVWAHQLNTNPGDYRRILITTSTLDTTVAALDADAPGNSTARMALITALNKVATDAPNKELTACYGAWRSLSSHEREQIINTASAMGKESHLAQISTDLERAVRSHHIPPGDCPRVARAIDGWFLQTVSERLTASGCRVTAEEAWTVIEEEHRNNLLVATPPEPPSDADTLQATAAALCEQDEVFLRQLRLLGADDSALTIAALFYSRARVARERWLENAAISRTQITTFATDLTDYWQITSSEACREMPADPKTQQTIGWRIHDECMKRQAPFGPSLAPTYLTRGSYHMLANEPRLGWHPDYTALLRRDDA